MSEEDIPYISEDISPPHEGAFESVRQECTQAKGECSWPFFMFYGAVIFIVSFYCISYALGSSLDLGNFLQNWIDLSGQSFIALFILYGWMILAFCTGFFVVGIINVYIVEYGWKTKLIRRRKSVLLQGSCVNVSLCVWALILFLFLSPFTTDLTGNQAILGLLVLILLVIGSGVISRIITIRFRDKTELSPIDDTPEESDMTNGLGELFG